jgi:uncharacterized protein with HEPN domain
VLRRDGLAQEIEPVPRHLRVGLALERLLQRIADAAHRVSRHGREAHTEVPWDRLDLLGETVSTEHGEIDARVLFAIVTREGSMLIDALERALPSDAD